MHVNEYPKKEAGQPRWMVRQKGTGLIRNSTKSTSTASTTRQSTTKTTKRKVQWMGIEPTTSAVLKPRHNQLDHLCTLLLKGTNFEYKITFRQDVVEVSKECKSQITIRTIDRKRTKYFDIRYFYQSTILLSFNIWTASERLTDWMNGPSSSVLQDPLRKN